MLSIKKLDKQFKLKGGYGSKLANSEKGKTNKFRSLANKSGK